MRNSSLRLIAFLILVLSLALADWTLKCGIKPISAIERSIVSCGDRQWE